MYICEPFRAGCGGRGTQQFKRFSGQMPVLPHTSNLVSKERFRYPLKAVNSCQYFWLLWPHSALSVPWREEAENAALAKVVEPPLGEGAAKLLAQIKRVPKSVQRS
jgi:hypothetical protein